MIPNKNTLLQERRFLPWWGLLWQNASMLEAITNWVGENDLVALWGAMGIVFGCTWLALAIYGKIRPRRRLGKSVSDRLGQFIDDLDRDSIRRAYDAVAVPEYKMGAAVSVVVVKTAGVFWKRLYRECETEAQNDPTRVPVLDGGLVVLEAVAYLHSRLMYAYIGPQKLSGKNDSYWEALANSLDFSHALLGKRTGMQVAYGDFIARVMFYARPVAPWSDGPKTTDPHRDLAYFLLTGSRGQSFPKCPPLLDACPQTEGCDLLRRLVQVAWGDMSGRLVTTCINMHMRGSIEQLPVLPYESAAHS